MHQQWTYGEREDLLPYLDGEDDEIFEYAIENRNFAIILKNDTTYDVCDTEDEAIEKSRISIAIMPWCKTTKICATSRATTRTNDTKRLPTRKRTAYSTTCTCRAICFSSPSSAKSSLSDTVRTKCARKCTSITGRNTRICIDLILSLFGTQEICLNFELILPQKHKKKHTERCAFWFRQLSGKGCGFEFVCHHIGAAVFFERFLDFDKHVSHCPAVE